MAKIRLSDVGKCLEARLLKVTKRFKSEKEKLFYMRKVYKQTLNFCWF